MQKDSIETRAIAIGGGRICRARAFLPIRPGALKRQLHLWTAMLLLSVAGFEARGQLVVGFSSALSTGPYSGGMASATSGSVNLGTPASPVTFGTADPGQTWTKQFSINIATTGINQGANLIVTENLKWDGTGPAALSDWHETMGTAGDIFAAGILNLGTLHTGTTSSGNTVLDFGFSPQSSAVAFTIQENIIYGGPTIAPGTGSTITFQITERPSIVPEPRATALTSSLLLLLWVAWKRLLHQKA